MNKIQSYLRKLMPNKSDDKLYEEFVEVKLLIERAKESVMETQRQKELLETMTHAMGGMVWIKKWDL